VNPTQAFRDLDEFSVIGIEKVEEETPRQLMIMKILMQRLQHREQPQLIMLHSTPKHRTARH